MPVYKIQTWAKHLSGKDMTPPTPAPSQHTLPHSLSVRTSEICPAEFQTFAFTVPFTVANVSQPALTKDFHANCNSIATHIVVTVLLAAMDRYGIWTAFI